MSPVEHCGPAWCDPFLYRPFVRGAAGPEAFDCWGIVRAGLRARFAIEVPPLDDAHLEDFAHRMARAIEIPGSPWNEIRANDAREGDVLAISLDELHAGLVVSNEWMLHARIDVGTKLDRWRRGPWYPAILAAYRHRELLP